MGSVNQVTLMGRLGKDPEIKFTASGKQIANFTIATDSGIGENKKTEWHRCVAWEGKADIVNRFLSKGKMVYVQGAIEYKSWEQNGEKKYMTQINVFNIQLIDNKDAPQGGNGGGSKYSGGSGGNQSQNRQPAPQHSPAPQMPDDDIPF